MQTTPLIIIIIFLVVLVLIQWLIISEMRWWKKFYQQDACENFKKYREVLDKMEELKNENYKLKHKTK